MHLKTRQYLFISSIIVVSLLLTACNTLQRIQTSEITGRFDETFNLYSKHLRWSHFKQLTTFMTPEQIAPALEKIQSLEGRKISSVRPQAWIFDEKENVMVGDVDIDYYVVDRGVIRSTTQHQTWRLNGETWQLDSGLPNLP